MSTDCGCCGRRCAGRSWRRSLPRRALQKDAATYLHQVDDLYTADAYNSLSIEGYRVSAELIERVRSGNWNPDNNQNDRQNRDALAARGYWQAFQSVKQSLVSI